MISENEHPPTEYVQLWHNPYLVLPVWLFFTSSIGLSVVLSFYEGFIGHLHLFRAEPNLKLWARLGFFISAIGFSYLFIQIRGFFNDSYVVIIKGDKLLGIKMFGITAYVRNGERKLERVNPRWINEIDFDDIVEILPLKRPLCGLKFYSRKRKKKILEISGGINKLGEITERILPLALNLLNFDLARYPEYLANWGKEPDWTIINTAKRRAEENRKKLQQSQSETQGTKESV